MGFLTSLLGSDNAYLTAVIGLGIVVILIIIGVWLLKLISEASRTAGRGRSRRLGVVDSVMLDQRRQAVLLRRDNVEHLIVTGGPQDLVIETAIAPPQPLSASRPAPRGSEPRQQDDHMPDLRSEGRTGADSPAIARSRPANPARQRATLRNTGLLRPVGQGEPLAAGGMGQNGLRTGSDSGRTEGFTAQNDRGAAGYESVDMGEGEYDPYQDSDERRRDGR